jgi:hypothetical protein
MWLWRKDFMSMIAAKESMAAQVRLLAIDNAKLEAGVDRLSAKLATAQQDVIAANDRVMKLEAVNLSLQDRITSLQNATRYTIPDITGDIMSESEEDIQALIQDIHKLGRDAVILRESKNG